MKIIKTIKAFILRALGGVDAKELADLFEGERSVWRAQTEFNENNFKGTISRLLTTQEANEERIKTLEAELATVKNRPGIVESMARAKKAEEDAAECLRILDKVTREYDVSLNRNVSLKRERDDMRSAMSAWRAEASYAKFTAEKLSQALMETMGDKELAKAVVDSIMKREAAERTENLERAVVRNRAVKPGDDMWGPKGPPVISTGVGA